MIGRILEPVDHVTPRFYKLVLRNAAVVRVRIVTRSIAISVHRAVLLNTVCSLSNTIARVANRITGDVFSRNCFGQDHVAQKGGAEAR